jgi:ABC-2 type transport system permease protein
MMRDICPSLNELVVRQYYHVLEIILIFILPILTMRAISEEKQRGTFELLATSPLTPVQIVFGKFLGLCGVVGVMLLLSFAFPLVLIIFTDPEVMPIFVGFFGLLLYAASFIAIGLAVSSCTSSQTIAGIVGLVVLLVFSIIDAPAVRIGGDVAEFLTFLDPSNHFDTFVKGVLTGADVVYFLSVTAFGLFAANRVLEAQDWR